MDRFEWLQQELTRRCPGLEVRTNEPMSRHTSFRIGGPARLMALPKSAVQAKAAVLAAREAGRRTVLVEAEAERSGGPEEERPLRLRRLGFYARNGCTPVYESFNCGLLCQVFVLGPAPADRADLKAAHRAIYGPARTDVVIDPPPGASPEPPYWM